MLRKLLELLDALFFPRCTKNQQFVLALLTVLGILWIVLMITVGGYRE